MVVIDVALTCNPRTAPPRPRWRSSPPLRGVDAGLGAVLARFPNVHDNQVRFTRVGQSLFNGVGDRHVMPELGDNLGHPL